MYLDAMLRWYQRGARWDDWGDELIQVSRGSLGLIHNLLIRHFHSSNRRRQACMTENLVDDRENLSISTPSPLNKMAGPASTSL